MTVPRAFLLPLVGTAIFVLIIGFELVGSERGSVPSDSRPNGPLKEQSVPATNHPPSFAEDLADTILVRPLFTPGRQARAGDGTGPVDGTMPRLAGIVIAGKRKLAVFQRSNDKALSLSEGDTIGMWTIKAINRRDVVLQRPGGTMTIEPATDSTLAQPGAGIPQVTNPQSRKPFAPAQRVRP